MLEHNETMKLIERANNGDKLAIEELLSHNSPLLKSLIRRFKNKGVETEDLYQLACLGFLKAIKNFDTKYNVRFSTYAVPMILGEVKRFLRDDGSIKVSRNIKILSYKINKFVSDYQNEFDKPPSISEISKKFEIEDSEVVFAMESGKSVVSIYDKISGEKDNGIEVVDKLQSKDSGEALDDKILLKEIINSLPIRDKKIIILRYYRDKTQEEISKIIGVSQVQVSRLESKIIELIKSKYKD